MKKLVALLIASAFGVGAYAATAPEAAPMAAPAVATKADAPKKVSVAKKSHKKHQTKAKKAAKPAA